MRVGYMRAYAILRHAAQARCAGASNTRDSAVRAMRC